MKIQYNASRRKMRRAVLVLMMSATVLSVVSDARGWSGKRESNGIIDYGPFIASHLPLTRSTLPGHAVLVDKTKQKLFLYAREDAWREVLRFDCSTGENRGPKLKSGDGKTPEGVYFFTHAYDNRELSETYGTRAFPIDYPNLLDKFAGHTGNAIWLHGTNKPLKPRDSNGCIVLANVDIDRLAPYLKLNRTPIVIVGQLQASPHTRESNAPKAPLKTPLLARTSGLKATLEAEKDARRARQAALKEETRIIVTIDLWLTAWSSKDLKTYGSFYARDFRHKQMDLRAWLKYKDRLNRQYAYIRVNRSKLSIRSQAEITTATFVQTYESDRFRAVGLKTLLLKKENGVWKIYREEWKKS